MRAATYAGDQTIRVEERTPEAPGPGQVRLEVAYVGICGTDLHIKHGAMDARVTLPAVIGHEMSGTVAAVGDGVSAWMPGDRVTVMPLRWCGECAACRAGHRHICQRLVFVGIDAPGALQQSWTVEQEIVVGLPEGLTLDHAALAEPAAVAVHDVRRADLRPGERALVVGGGPIGLLIATVAAAGGAEVLVSEPNGFRRRLAAEMGLSTVDPLAEDVVARVDAWTDGAGADAAFEVSGSAPGLLAATHALRVRGRLVVVAIHSEPVPLDLFRVFWRELQLIGARVYQRADFEQAVELLATGAIPAARLISSVEPIDRTPEAFAELEGGGNVMKVLIDCGEAAVA
jgi:(R,R)-butanediol dehydrogenase / meso-butanediol dehydrogenase / diacetyl reductase